MYASFFLAQVGPATGTATPPAGTPAAPPAGDTGTHTVAPGGTPITATTQADKPFNPSSFILPILLVLMLYLFLFRPKSKEAKQQKAMLESLKRGDRVMTIGGLIGSVVEVRGDEVVLKVDESNNVKERYVKSAIQKVLVDGDKAEDTKK